MKHNFFANRLMPVIAVIIMLATLASCKKFLESKPVSTASVAQFYKTPADFEQAIVGCYATLGNLYTGNGYYCLITDLRSDNTTEFGPGGGGNEAKLDIDRFTVTSDNEHLTEFWAVSYTLIARVNAILEKIDGITVDQAAKDSYIGQAKAIRALAYFNMVRLWGGVPLVTEPVSDLEASYKVGRSSSEEIYNQITADLTDAEGLLPDSYPEKMVGKITKGAAQSILGEVYLTLKKYPEAVTQFKKVVDGNKYKLLDNYSDLFKGTNQGNSESIFAIQYMSGGNNLGSNFPGFFAPIGSQKILLNGGGNGSFGFNQPTEDIAAAYSNNDVRKNNIGTGYTDANGNFVVAPYIKGYVSAPAGSGYLDSDADWYIVRYADVLLMYAEALNEANNGPAGDAFTALNLVRKRAGLAEISGLDYNAFKVEVYEQERLEAPFEGHRWFDLIRTGRALSVMNSKVATPGSSTTIGITSPIKESQLLYPIPQIVIITSAPAIEQNPGYN